MTRSLLHRLGKRAIFLGMTSARAASLLLAATLALACGSHEDSVELEGESFTVESEAGKFEVETLGEGVRISGAEEDVGAISGQFGENVEIPTGFPKDVPLYPDATVVAAMMAGDQAMVTLRTGDDFDQVAGFLREHFEQEGWSFGSQLDLMGQYVLAFEKGDRVGAVQLSREESDTTIMITIGSGD